MHRVMAVGSVRHVLAQAVVWALALVPVATAQVKVTFEKVVDSQTPMPGSSGTFAGFTMPGLRGSNVAFYAWGNLSERGIYLKTPIGLRVIADTSTPVPGGTAAFGGFYDPPLISDTEVTFVGWGNNLNGTGVYLHSGGALSRVADTSTPIPGTQDVFTYFRTASVDQGQVAFAASGQSTSEAVYAAMGGQIQLVAGSSTPMPGSGGPFGIATWPVVRNGVVVFLGNGSSSPFRQGIYSRSFGGPVTVLADTDTPDPGGTGTFGGLVGGFSVDHDGGVGFGAFGSGGGGDYTYRSGSVSLVANPTTPVPAGSGTFTSLRAISLENGHVAFAATSVDREGIYANLDGTLVKVIDSKDRLDGKGIAQLNLGAQALSNDVIAFSVVFVDGSSGIYLASLSLARVCSTTLTPSPSGLDVRFDLRTADPVTWNLWLSYASNTVRLWSVPLPAIGTTVSIPWSIPGLVNRGSLGFLSTFVVSPDGIVCSDWDVVDTGHP